MKKEMGAVKAALNELSDAMKFESKSLRHLLVWAHAIDRADSDEEISKETIKWAEDWISYAGDCESTLHALGEALGFADDMTIDHDGRRQLLEYIIRRLGIPVTQSIAVHLGIELRDGEMGRTLDEIAPDPLYETVAKKKRSARSRA